MNEVLVKVKPSDHIDESSKEYSLYVCEQRAIPKAIDGLKSAQRKALYLMQTRAGEIKTVSLAGEMISSGLYIHGDASASDTCSLLAAPYCNNLPWLMGIGTFGTKVSPKSYAAPRYTYVKRPKYAEEILYADKDVIPMQENYDGSTKEPTHFLPIIPTVLLNGVSGIAVGWSTDILPRSLADLVNATAKAIEGKRFNALKPKYEYMNCDVEKVDDSWVFSGKVTVKDHATAVITELPPDLSLEKFKDRLNKLEDDQKIQSYTDNSTDHIDIEVKFKRGSLKTVSDEDLVKLFKLTTRKTERIVTVDWDNKSIRQFESAEQLIKEFVEERFKFYVSRFEKLRDDDEYDLRYWKALKLCFDKNLPTDILKAKDKAAVVSKIQTITKSCKLDDKQVERIASVPSYNWAKDRYAVVKARIKELEGNIKKYKGLLAKPDGIRDIFKSEVLSIGKMKIEVER